MAGPRDLSDPGWKPDPSSLPTEPVDRLASDGFIDSAMKRARTDVNVWLYRERALYADKKYDDEKRHEGVRLMATEGLGGEYWDVFLTNYWSRAKLLDVSTPQGRQALGKLIVTFHAALEAAVVAFGPMPEPGVPSGEIK